MTAPVGTVVVIEVVVHAVITALLLEAFHSTSFSDGIVLKLVPVITTGVPTTPDDGLKDVIVGGPEVPVVIFITKAA